MAYIRICDSQSIPIALLREADPCDAHIQRYLSDSVCYAMLDDSQVIFGVCVVQSAGDESEIKNLAIKADMQGMGFGKRLVSYVVDDLVQRGVTKLSLSTGCFGYQLYFYQKLGFRVEKVLKNHFLHHYTSPITELGIQHKDALWLSLSLEQFLGEH